MEADPPYHQHHHHISQSRHHKPLIFSYPLILLIAIPISIVLVFIIIFLILLITRRPRSGRTDGNFGKDGISDEKQHSRFNTTTTSRGVVDFGNERSCIYGGKMPINGQVKYKGGHVFTYKELELATNGFSEANVIGAGGFGTVFRGILSDGTVAAVKVLHTEGRRREREFRVEEFYMWEGASGHIRQLCIRKCKADDEKDLIASVHRVASDQKVSTEKSKVDVKMFHVDLLSRLHSRYLVGLLGYCADQHHRLLVFEFMPNGSLHQHLHPTFSHNPWQPLDWWTRLRIALDCARGLEFLHEHSVPAVIHRDLKCTNILLDHNYRAKVSDFGMAKMGSDKINGHVLTRVLGTTGYLAPEYASTGKLTTKSDVYSYGMVLLELITGRLPIDTRRPPEEHVLVKWALPRLTNREKVEKMVDPVLKGQYSQKDLIQVAAIAAVCVQPEADYRPLMADIVQSLIPLVQVPAPSYPNTPSRHHSKATAALQISERQICMC